MNCLQVKVQVMRRQGKVKYIILLLLRYLFYLFLFFIFVQVFVLFYGSSTAAQKDKRS